jgi:hypothetical protein
VTGITRAVCRIIRHGVVCVAASAESQVRCNDKAAVNVYTAGSNEALDKEVHVSAPGVKCQHLVNAPIGLALLICCGGMDLSCETFEDCYYVGVWVLSTKSRVKCLAKGGLCNACILGVVASGGCEDGSFEE